jgi:hypothetical protein
MVLCRTGDTNHQEKRILVTSIIILLLAALMQGMTLMLMESRVCIDHAKGGGDSCDLSYGGRLSIGPAASSMYAAIFFMLITDRKEAVHATAGSNGYEVDV